MSTRSDRRSPMITIHLPSVRAVIHEFTTALVAWCTR